MNDSSSRAREPVRPRELIEELIDSADVTELRCVLLDPSDDGKVDKFRELVQTRLVTNGTWPLAPASPPSVDAVRYELLRFLVDEDRSRVQVQALADQWPGFDRDGIVLDLWKTIDESFVTRVHLSMAYHQQRLFAWFVDRYDLSRARRLYTRVPALYTGLQFVPAIAAAIALYTPQPPAISLLILLAGYLAPTLVWRLSGLPAMDFVQSLVPRLAGTSAAGAALMLSASELLKFIFQKMDVMTSLVLLGLAVVYLGLEIQHRVRPRLRARELANRVANVVFLALPYAAAIVILIVPAIRHLLNSPDANLSATELLAFTTTVFTAGLVLNVIWAEEPITRPL